MYPVYFIAEKFHVFVSKLFSYCVQLFFNNYYCAVMFGYLTQFVRILSLLTYFKAKYVFQYFNFQIDANEDDYAQPLKEYILFTDAIKV